MRGLTRAIAEMNAPDRVTTSLSRLSYWASSSSNSTPCEENDPMSSRSVGDAELCSCASNVVGRTVSQFCV